MIRTRILVIALPLFVAGISGCAKTTIDSSITEAPVVASTTTLPTGTAAELLPRLVIEAGKLSNIIGAQGDKNDQMHAITNLWNAARPEIAARNPDLVKTFDFAVDLCEKGRKFNRPADADKCFRNLTTLTNSYRS